MKRSFNGILILLCMILAACKSVPDAPNGTSAPTPAPTPSATLQTPGSDTDIVAQFDTVTITKKTFEAAKTEIQVVVEDLNRITLAKDYNRWLTYLSDEYLNTYSDPATLDTVSKSLPTKGITLKNLRDYFNYVFVPSRQNMRVDNIQFVSPTRVYVIMEIAPNSPAAIYILEKTDRGWKLVIKNQ